MFFNNYMNNFRIGISDSVLWVLAKKFLFELLFFFTFYAHIPQYYKQLF